ncbi:MAG: hypothetical protein E6Q97_29575 [Desulfurellales bacterium]|nr:MAG: hypothetical protein E6Q97_29575 [Desulfurellales bacterium]
MHHTPVHPVPIPTTPDDVAAAIERVHATSPFVVAEDIRLQFARFDSARKAFGTHIEADMATWARYRHSVATKPWPGPDKESLPAEIGAILAQSLDDNGTLRPRRRGIDVAAFTWLFLDSDRGHSGQRLRTCLDDLNIAYLMVESASSMYNGNPLKWHLIIPLSEPKELPSRNLPNIDAAATLHATADWWFAVSNHVAAQLFLLGGLPANENDSTAGSFPRMAYVPHMPPDGRERRVSWKDGRLFQLDAFLTATGFSGGVEAPIVYVAAGKAGTASNSNGSGSSGNGPSTNLGNVNFDGGDDFTGPTPNETTGSLVYRALDYFGLVGPKEDDNSYRALCPWRENHSVSGSHNPDSFDDSVVVYVRGSQAGEQGGFKCYHDGGGVDGQCSRASASDVIRWARKNGCPLPDTAAWGGGEAAVGSIAGASEPHTTNLRAEGSSSPTAAISSPTPTAGATPQENAVESNLGTLVANTAIVPNQAARPRPLAFPGAPRTSSPPPTPRTSYIKSLSDDEKIKIVLDDTRLDAAREAAILALSKHPKYYTINGVIYDIVYDDKPDRSGSPRRPWLRKATYADLVVEFCAVSRWMKETFDRKGGVQEAPQRPDKQVVSSVLVAGRYPRMRELNGMTHTPVFRPDGTLLQQQGYDDSTGILYRADSRVPLISDSPGRDDLAKSLATFRDLLSDFMRVFAEPELAFGVWLSMIFTRLLRYHYSGNQPMFVISAGDAGSGKGLLADIVALIADAEDAEVIRGYSGDDAETERLLGMALKKRAPVIVWDNIARGTVLASTAFEAFLTTPKFTTRQVGTSDAISKGYWDDALQVATGNGLQTGGDMSRRVLRIDINDTTGSPTSRQLRIPDLKGYCRLHRPELVRAALTLLAGFFAAKRGGWQVSLPHFASFNRWSVVREAIVWCGLPDPYLARGRAEDDADTANFRFAIEHLRSIIEEGGLRRHGDGVLVGDVVKLLVRDHASAAPKFGTAYSFFVEAGVTLGAQHGAAVSLGKFLTKYEGRVLPDGDVKWQLRLRRAKGGSVVTVGRV